MTEINTIIGFSNLFTALIIFIVVIPLKKKKIKMNWFYGFRIPKSFTSDENWYKINEYGADRFIVWSIPIFIIGIVTFFFPFNGNDMLIMIFAFAPLIILIPVIDVILYAKKL